MDGIESRHNAPTDIGNGKAKVLRCMRRHPRATIAQIAQKCGLSRSAVDRLVRRLKEGGVIARAGSRRAGQWLVNE